MNTTDLEIMPDAPSQPARITRRTFVKRTSATVIVTVLALHAFRNEARAETSGSSSGELLIKLDSLTPAPVPPEGWVKATGNINNNEKVQLGISGQSVDYWKKVGKTQASWTIDVEVDGGKFTGNNCINGKTLFHSFKVLLDSDKNITVQDLNGDTSNFDGALVVGLNINAVVAQDKQSVSVAVNGTTAWNAAMNQLTGIGFNLSIAGYGGGLSLAWAANPTLPQSTGITFIFKIVNQ